MRDMINIIIYYWPKLIAAIWFAIVGLVMIKKSRYAKKDANVVLYFIAFFFTSSALFSIYAECFANALYFWVIEKYITLYQAPIVYVLYQITWDALFVFAGGMIFSQLSGMKNFMGAVLYMEFVCSERLASTISFTAPGYLIVFILIQFVLFMVQRKDFPYTQRLKAIEWKRIFVYLMGLFYITDILYGANIFFPELDPDNLNPANMIWLDSVAIICGILVMGYIRISFAEAKQEYKKQEYQKRLQHSQEDIIVSLSEITEAKSGETGQHIRRVAEYSKCLAKHILKEPSDVENIRIAAMMHDIGKLMISQDILEKPGRLTRSEYDAVKEHSAFGWNLLANSKGEVMEMARVIALEHHERWDGGGYPGGLKGDEISIYAQIVSVADVYDALTSKRSYKDAWDPDDARKEIVAQRGKQFAPRVVDAFVSCYSEIEEIRRQYADTI